MLTYAVLSICFFGPVCTVFIFLRVYLIINRQFLFPVESVAFFVRQDSIEMISFSLAKLHLTSPLFGQNFENDNYICTRNFT